MELNRSEDFFSKNYAIKAKADRDGGEGGEAETSESGDKVSNKLKA